MYKHTRHTNKSWTYASASLRSPFTGTEEESQKLLTDSKAKLLQVTLLRPEEFVLDHMPTGDLFSFGRVINDRIRRGCSFLRKHSFPDDLIRTVPNYFIIAPKLGAVLARLQRKSLHQVPADLLDLYRYLLDHGAPERPGARPVFSEDAVRVKAEDVPPPPQPAPPPRWERKKLLEKPARRRKPRKATPAEAPKQDPTASAPAVTRRRPSGEKTALEIAFEAARKKT